MLVNYKFLVVCTFLCGLFRGNVAGYLEGCPPANHWNCTFLSKYMQLWCDDSNITEIPNPTTIPGFSPAKLATALYMNKSCISEINTENLGKFQDLKLLDFVSNRIQTLSDFTFVKCKKLRILRMSHNQIEAVGPHVFAELKRLRVLKLNHNKISVLPERLFRDLTRLQFLDLSDNKLLRITAKLFRNLLFLISLDLSKNSLTTLTMWDLRGLPQLRSLNLRGNAISKVDRYAFFSCPELQTVDLRENAITCLDQKLFEKSEISTILLNDNLLKTPKPTWCRNLPRNNQRAMLRNIESVTANNKWICDCGAIPYQRFLTVELKDLDFWVRKLDIPCSGPAVFKGQMLSNISVSAINRHYNNECKMFLDFKWEPCSAKTIASSPKKAKTDAADQAITTPIPTSLSPLAVQATKPGELEAKSLSLEHLQFVSFVITCLLVAAFFIVLALLVCMLYRRERARKHNSNAACSTPDESIVFGRSTISSSDTI